MSALEVPGRRRDPLESQVPETHPEILNVVSKEIEVNKNRSYLAQVLQKNDRPLKPSTISKKRINEAVLMLFNSSKRLFWTEGASLYPSAKAYYSAIFAHMLGKEEVSDIDVLKLVKSLELGKTGVKKLCDMAERYRDIIRQEQETLERVFNEVRDDIVEKTKKFVQEKKLPESALQNLPRLMNVHVGIQETCEDTHDISGQSVHLNVAWIASHMMLKGREASLRTTIAHELLHDLSGIAQTMRYSFITGATAKRYKIGLSGGASGKWINEAATVRLNNMYGYEDNAYSEEASTLDWLVNDYNHVQRKEGVATVHMDEHTKGIDEMVVWEAYFENWAQEGDRKVNPATSKFRKLVDEVNRVEKERHDDEHGWLLINRRFEEKDEYKKKLKGR